MMPVSSASLRAFPPKFAGKIELTVDPDALSASKIEQIVGGAVDEFNSVPSHDGKHARAEMLETEGSKGQMTYSIQTGGSVPELIL